MSIDFLGGSGFQILVWTEFVVPCDEYRYFITHVVDVEWDKDSARAFVFECSVESFDYCDASVFADGAETWFDFLFATPFEVWMFFSVFWFRIDRVKLSTLICAVPQNSCTTL